MTEEINQQAEANIEPGLELTFVQVKEPEQIAELAIFAEGIFTEHFSKFHPEEKVNFLKNMMLSPGALIHNIADEGYEYYFANAADRHAGFVAVAPREDLLFLSKFYMAACARGKGYGSKMFAFVKQRAEELGLHKIQLTCARDNEGSINVYKHFGFQIVESVDNEVGEGIVMSDYVMEYTL